MPTMSDLNNAISHLISDTTRCVQCGLCLPHCPTYSYYQDENESPRGRLLLMRFLAKATTDQPRARYHLSRCLHCSACEAACPAGVEYRQLLDKTLSLQEQHQPIITASWRWKIGAWILTRPLLLHRAGRVLRFYQRSKLRALTRHSGLLTTLKLVSVEQDLPVIPVLRQWSESYPADTEYRGQVMLFLGCVARVFDQKTLLDAIFILQRAGYTVVVPKGQNCCGALHVHHGDQATGQRVAQQNIRAFTDHESCPILTTASGCAAMLLDYGKQFSTPSAQNFSTRITDLSEFLVREVVFEPSQFITTALRVAVHDPCSLRNIVGQTAAPYQLLSELPGIELLPLAHNTVCCGAAGIHHLTHPQLATSLRQPKLEAIDQLQPDILVTSNIGCAMHLASGLRKAAVSPPILHPVSLLRNRLKQHQVQ